MTTPFHAPPECRSGDRLVLPPEEAHHATRVLRHEIGDLVEVVDGDGRWYRVRLSHVGRDEVSGEIIEERLNYREPAYSLTLAVSPLKNANRFETLVEKAVELGVTRIQPILCSRTEKPRIRMERLERVAIAAMKQSRRSRRLVLEEIREWKTFAIGATRGFRLILHEGGGGDFGSVLQRAAVGEEIVAAVGPEGGFTDEEVELAVEAGFEPVYLGPRRLRTETAAIAAAAAAMVQLQVKVAQRDT